MNLLKISFWSMFLMPLSLLAQSNLVNNGAIIKVSNGVDFRVEQGNIRNDAGGTIDNQGNIYLDGNFNQVNAAVYNGSATSWLWFEGSANEIATGDAPLNIAKLRVDNGNRLILGNHVNVSNQVDLTNNGDIELGNFNLVVASGGAVTGYDANNYIITNGTGYLQRQVGAAAVDFPIGISNYNLATLTNSGTVDNFQARLEDFVRGAYPVGNVETVGMVGRAWFIEEQTVGGSNVTMTLRWDNANELPLFIRSASGISHWTGTIWDRSPTWTAATNVAATSWTQTRTGITSFSPFAVEDIDMDLPIELLSFNAVRQSADMVDLTWSTASELNNQGFHIERMLDTETSFEPIAWVDGQGTTSDLTNYELTDNNGHPGISYYRLRQVDFDGTESFSEIRAVRNDDSHSGGAVTLFPVPVTDALNVRFGVLPAGVESGEVRIFDVQGRLLFNATVALQSNQVLSIEAVSNWPSAMYMLNIRLADGTTMTEKFVKE